MWCCMHPSRQLVGCMVPSGLLVELHALHQHPEELLLLMGWHAWVRVRVRVGVGLTVTVTGEA